MQQNLQNKKGLVESVFDKVYDKYDLMNDFMSLGIHRIWKKDLMTWMNPSRNKKLIPTLLINDTKGKLLRSYNLPVGAHLMINEGDSIKEGKILVKIPRKSAKSGCVIGHS